MRTRNVNIKELKNSLRLHSRSFRESMEENRKKKADASIFRRLTSLREYAQARWIYTYVSKPIEVDTIALIRRALADEKHVAVPRCVPGTREMEFYEIRSLEELEPGAFGVLEPVPGRSRLVQEDTGGLCVVPGLSFDSEGYRLGYGKGYYDRLLSRFRGVSVGACYSGCVRRMLPHGYFDRPVDILVTERCIRNISKPAVRPHPGNGGNRKHERKQS